MAAAFIDIAVRAAGEAGFANYDPLRICYIDARTDKLGDDETSEVKR
jgi:hypothetical protein